MINARSALVDVDERIISSGQTCLVRVFQIGAIIKTHEGWYMEKRWSVRVIKPRFLLRGKTTLNARYQDACRNSISRFPAPWTRNVISFPSGTDSVRVAALFSCIESIVISVRIYRNGFHRFPWPMDDVQLKRNHWLRAFYLLCQVVECACATVINFVQ